jgi:hypothetical protein
MTETKVADAKAASTKTHPICKACGSDDVVKDAWVFWNPETGLWELVEVFDYSFCRACEQSTELAWIETPAAKTRANKTAEIRRLNDALRRGESQDGMIVVTAGVRAMGQEFLAEAKRAVAAFDAFTEDNDPYNEHDFGALTVRGEKLFFKIDTYDLSMTAHSPDPADPTVTRRVLTIMRADECAPGNLA